MTEPTTEAERLRAALADSERRGYTTVVVARADLAAIIEAAIRAEAAQPADALDALRVAVADLHRWDISQGWGKFNTILGRIDDHLPPQRKP